MGRTGTEPTRSTGATAAAGVPRRREGLALPDFVVPASIARKLARWTSLEMSAARGPVWLPVAIGLGILAYFAAEREPSAGAALIAVALLALVAFAARSRPVAFAVAVGLAAVAAGFAAATLRTALVAHPALSAPTGVVAVSGFVEQRESRERSDRIVLRVTGIEPAPRAERPVRVRLVLRKGTAPAVGAHVSARTRLEPLPGPAYPGGYHFARDAWFLGIGATGLVFGRPTPAETSISRGWWLAAWQEISTLRAAISARIRTVLPGTSGAIADALVTGDRGGIPEATNEAMRVSGLYHVISISGMHMVLVVGAVFALVRGGLALVPGLALRWPIRAWAAATALAAAAFYLLLSGAEVATTRAFLMIALVLVGMLVGRVALSLRTLAAAAALLLLVWPESLLHPGFQMSFAATLALVSAYEAWAPRQAAEDSANARLLRTAATWIGGLALTALIAGLATAPFAAFHFHRMASWGIAANLLAMPVVSLVVMPAALAGVLLMPFGLDRLAWEAMRLGIDTMTGIATMVQAWPGADGGIAAFGIGPLLVATAALLTGSILVGPLRWLAVPLCALASLAAHNAPRPEILVDEKARMFGFGTAAGSFAILDSATNPITARMWLAAAGDRRRQDLTRPATAFRCDAAGCVGRLPDGTAIAYSRTMAAIHEDCARAALVVTPLRTPVSCAARRIDPGMLERTGAIAVSRTRNPDGSTAWIVTASQDESRQRPWLPRRGAAATGPPDTTAPEPTRDDLLDP